jgi:hypothetical protein
MARNYFAQTAAAEIALGAGTLTCIARLNAPANQIVAIQGFDLSFDGTSTTAEPVIIQLLRVSTDGTGMSARNPLKTKDRAAALQTTGAVGPVTAGNLPTAGDILKTFHIHPQAGVVYPFPLNDQEIEIPGGGRLAIEVTAPAAVNCLFTMYGEE